MGGYKFYTEYDHCHLRFYKAGNECGKKRRGFGCWPAALVRCGYKRLDGAEGDLGRCGGMTSVRDNHRGTTWVWRTYDFICFTWKIELYFDFQIGLMADSNAVNGIEILNN